MSKTRRRPGRRRLTRRLMAEARPYRLHLVGATLLGLLATPLMLLSPVPIAIAVDSGLNGKPLPGVLLHLPASVSSSSFDVLIVAGVLQVLIAFLLQVQSGAFAMLSTYTGERLTLGLRARLFRHVQHLSLAYHDARGTADAIYRVQYDAPAVQDILVDGLIPVLSASVAVVAMIYVTVRIDALLAAVALCVAPFLFVAARGYRRWTKHHYRAAKGIESTTLGVVQEVLGNLRVVKAFGKEESEQERFLERASAGMRARMRLAWFESLFSLGVNMITAVGTAAVLVLGIQQVRSGAISLGALLVVISYMYQLYSPLKTVSKKAADLQTSFAGAERAFEVLDLLPEVPERPWPRRLRRARGQITVESVSFGYAANAPVLVDVGFSMTAGTTLALRGRTGAGKTTLVGLLARFYDPVAGRILLDGVDLRDYAVADLRNQFAFVPQEPVLFSTSIAENISYADPAANRRKVVAAAKAAGAHGFIQGLPDGYDTLVGERGMRLSGGERQRISLARAFLKDAPILVLDEPTSSVDLQTERGIVRATERLMQGRTTIVISHRPSTVRGCDASIELERGGIVRTVGVTVSSRGGLPRVRDRRRRPATGHTTPPVRDPNRAVGAWRIVNPRSADPAGVEEVLDPRGRRPWKSSVYRLLGVGPGDTSVIAKRTVRSAALVEQRVYEAVLAELPLATPRFYGFLADGDAGWLFLEDVSGQMFSEDDRRHRDLAARWLALLHTETADMPELFDLPDRGPARYLSELRSAREAIGRCLSRRTFGPEGNATLVAILGHLDALGSAWRELERRCRDAPRCLVHADFTSKNVLVGSRDGSVTLRVLDWGSCGWGSVVADLPPVRLRRYRAAVRSTWPELDRIELERLAIVGGVFRTIVWTEREAKGLEHATSERAMRKLAYYEGELQRSRRLLEVG